MRHRLVSLLGFLTLGAVLAGCGGSTSAPATATITPTSAATSAPAATVSATRPAATAPAATTAATAATTAPSVAATSPAASAPTAPDRFATPIASAGDGKTVAVELKDYAITLSTSTVSAGMVTFNVKNSGPSAHNFNVMSNGEEKGVMTLNPGTTATLMLDLNAAHTTSAAISPATTSSA